jgi:hypothetical protein
MQWVPAQPPAQAWRVPPAAPSQAPRGTLAYQFSGSALWSIVFGLASALVPLFTPIYFPILPIFGLWRGVLAVRAGRVVGGVIGLVLNAIGCVVSLLASGLIH